jgi:hypothetical protein
MEFGAQLLLQAEHLAAIALVVVAGQVQHAVEDQHLDLGEQVVAEAGGLGPCRRDGDGDVSACGRGRGLGG